MCIMASVPLDLPAAESTRLQKNLVGFEAEKPPVLEEDTRCQETQ